MKRIPLKEGDKYNMLTVIRKSHSTKVSKNTRVYYKCQCDCGKLHTASSDSLRNGKSKSCGCLRVTKSTKHSLSSHPLYMCWFTMRYRCDKPNHKAYYLYGGRGISYYPAWSDFQTFYQWAIDNGWKKGLHFKRYDTDQDYTPDNCLFVNKEHNNDNLRNAIKVKVKGVELTLPKACRLYNKDYNLIRHRLYAGWDFDRAWDTPKNIMCVPKEKRLDAMMHKGNDSKRPVIVK